MDPKIVNVSHIEVVQAIQNANNEVPLIAGKCTFARVYFSPFRPDRNLTLAGKLQIEVNGVTHNTIPSEPVHWSAGLDYSLSLQRIHWSNSLHFKLPAAVVETPGKISLKLTELTGSDVVLGTSDVVSVMVSPHYTLSCRVLVFRYPDKHNRVYLEPSHEQVELIRDYIERAFPVATVGWSTVPVQVDQAFRALNRVDQWEVPHEERATRMMANLLRQTLLHRADEIDSDNGRENTRTFYLGVFVDPEDRFGGVAMDAPMFASTHAVAVGAVDDTGLVGAHELAHILGRQHPGVPLVQDHGAAIGQHRSDPNPSTLTSKYGHLSVNTGEADTHLGLNVGRPASRSPRVLAHNRWFDLMTYRHPQWLSAYTYKGIYDQLKEISDGNFINNSQNQAWTVICQYNLDRKQGQILHTVKSNYITAKPGSQAASRVRVYADFDNIGPISAQSMWNQAQSVYFRRPGSDPRHPFGLFQVTLTGAADKLLQRLYLMIDGVVVDAYGESGGHDTFTSIHSALDEKIASAFNSQQPIKGKPKNALVYKVREDSHYLYFDWSGMLPAGIDTKVTTAVQCRRATDDGSSTWETVFVSSRREAKVWISPRFFTGSGERPSARPSSQAVCKRGQQGVDIRFVFTIGFTCFRGRPIQLYQLKPRFMPTKEHRPKPRYKGLYLRHGSAASSANTVAS